MAIWEYPAQVLPYRLLAYSLRLSALALFGMTYSLRRWQIYWGLIVSISLDDSTTAEGAWHFCVGRLLLLRSKSGPVALSIITASVNWLSDKRYLCVRINPQVGPLSRTEQKSLWPQAVSRKNTDITTFIYNIWRDRQFGKSEISDVLISLPVVRCGEGFAWWYGRQIQGRQ